MGDKTNNTENANDTAVDIAPQYKSSFTSFLKDVASFTGDLSALTCPAFLLNGISLLEYSGYWADHPELFAAISEPESPADRMVAAARWFTSTLYGSYYARCVGSSEKKPYNPILGEQFLCKWNDINGCGETRLLAEQVSHHPPISAFYVENTKAGVYVNGHCGQKSKFKGTTIQVIQTGRVTLRLTKNDEVYVVTYPDLYIRSLFTGSPFLELIGTTTIECSNGLVTEFEFLGKPWFGGKYHKFTGNIYNKEAPENILYTIAGRWMADSTITNNATNKSETFFDATAAPPAERQVAPLEEQKDNESRKVWSKVTESLQKQDYVAANTFKSDIENAQRALRKERADSGEEWKQQLFHFLDDPAEENLNTFQSKTKGSSSDIGAWVYNNSLHLQNNH
ncbi:Oxysterol-binding protein [Basidiobolus meristosporus CBS 931.73]|uniref:Oxysterol-binding protein n=1 Tax=Basidiobolus meristosporus CBS 931.73 TaxID=1314790 RepID=A0A1Y1Z901_9FUNG|nr:Oxysterol-binding protein [Basidiobolus meristosporus CBS 931.73]|eukprot:ORY06584.1 Oxysterol-binding protein [Basidiobolus meristosporus CBS 931.73]